MTILLCLGVKLIPNLVARIEEHLKETFGELHLTNFQVNTATCCTFARDCTVGIAHSQSACLLRFSFLHRSRGILEESAETVVTLQVSRLTLNGTCVLVTRRCKDFESSKDSCWRPGTWGERSGYFGSKMQTWLLVFLWWRRLGNTLKSDNLTSLQNMNGTNSLPR